MRGQISKHIVAENVIAANPSIANKWAMAVKKKMCWKCQQEKSPVGGYIKTFKGGPMKFICRDCTDEKQLNNHKDQV